MLGKSRCQFRIDLRDIKPDISSGLRFDTVIGAEVTCAPVEKGCVVVRDEDHKLVASCECGIQIVCGGNGRRQQDNSPNPKIDGQLCQCTQDHTTPSGMTEEIDACAGEPLLVFDEDLGELLLGVIMNVLIGKIHPEERAWRTPRHCHYIPSNAAISQSIAKPAIPAAIACHARQEENRVGVFRFGGAAGREDEEKQEKKLQPAHLVMMC